MKCVQETLSAAVGSHFTHFCVTFGAENMVNVKSTHAILPNHFISGNRLYLVFLSSVGE